MTAQQGQCVDCVHRRKVGEHGGVCCGYFPPQPDKEFAHAWETIQGKLPALHQMIIDEIRADSNGIVSLDGIKIPVKNCRHFAYG